MKVKSGLRSGRGATVAATMAAVAAALVVQAPMAQADTAKALSCKARFNHNPMQIKGGVGVGANVVCDEKPTAFHVWLSLQHRTRDGKWIEQGADTSREIPNSWYNILAYTAHCEDRAWRAIVRIDVESGGKSVTDSVETPPTIINCNP